jgi:hypothetical protein
MIWIRLGIVSIAKAVRGLQFPFLRSQPAHRALK